MPPTDAVRVFISYSHDSPEHERRTFDLADKLRSEGIDCELDQFEAAPPEGWQRWMVQQVREAEYVLVVCTASYHRRVTGREREGVGLGAIWEGGLITQELYDKGGRNDKFIPVVFSVADTSEIPAFLRQTTYYNIADPSKYDALYRRLTAQPRVVRRPLGPLRRLGEDEPRVTEQDVGVVRTTGDSRDDPAEQLRPAPPAGPDSGNWPPGLALIRSPSGSMHFLPLLSVDVSGVITAVLRPGRSEDRVYLESLVSGRFNVPTIDFAFGFSAERARLTSATRAFDGGSDRYTLTLAPEAGAQRIVMEMSTTGYSADEIATLRARRILLDEHLPASTERSQGFGSGSMLESLVRGLQAPIEVERSPLPELYRSMGQSGPSRFVEAAKLTAVLWLRLSGTVDHVLDLEVCLESPDTLAVRFRGERRRRYVNRDPEVIVINGICQLR